MPSTPPNSRSVTELELSRGPPFSIVPSADGVDGSLAAAQSPSVNGTKRHSSPLPSVWLPVNETKYL